jgi:hypothetical protein
MELVPSREKVPARASATVAALVLATTVWLAGSAQAASSAKLQGSSAPGLLRAKNFAVSPPVRALPPASVGSPHAAPRRINPLAHEPNHARGGTLRRGAAPRDPLAANSSAGSGHTPAPSLVFNGSSNPSACGGCSPPDTNGDVGPSNYVQTVNATKVAIYDKGGTLQAPVFDLGDLWPSGPCANENGDPVVLYDSLADRWLLAQLEFSAGTNAVCVAVSQTADPTGSYFLYQFNTPFLPDYIKLGVWPTGYYLSTNEDDGYGAYALNRAKMLAGDPSANAIRFPGETNFLMPATVAGVYAPGQKGGLFYTFKDDSFHGGVDRIELFRLTPDFATPANSTFTTIKSFPIAPYTYTVCGFFRFDCIPQGGTGQKVDAVSEWPMFRFPYRRFADHRALVGNFTVGGGNGGAGAAVRWFELRNTGSGWTLFQEGTQDSPAVDQFMGSINVDQTGDIALGYSESSGATFPSIDYATRTPAEPAGTLEAEQVLKSGTGSQTGSDRWGDYSAMSIDPNNGCDFWYTNEYYSPSSAVNWKTAIGNFTVPACSAASRSLTVTTAGSGGGSVTGPGIHCLGDCTQSFAAGDATTLAATPAIGSTFAGFSGACSGTGACNLTMDADKSVTATFNTIPPPADRTLTMAIGGSGTGTVTGPGINCPGDCTETYVEGTSVTLNASAALGSTFAGFSGACSGTGSCPLTIDADKSVSATFNANPPPSPPNTKLTKAKINKKKHKAKFAFKAKGQASGLECKLKRKHHKAKEFKKCSSPKTYKHLKPGKYVFKVRAKGPGGTDPTPAKRKFKIKR